MQSNRSLFIPINEHAEEGLVYFRTDNKEHVNDLLKSFLCERDEIVFAYIYGSFCTDDHFRDIDVAVYLDPLPSNPLSYELGLSSELEVSFGIPVDVKAINAAPFTFCAQAIRGTLLFSKDETRRTGFELRVLQNSLDRISTIEFLRRKGEIT